MAFQTSSMAFAILILSTFACPMVSGAISEMTQLTVCP